MTMRLISGFFCLAAGLSALCAAESGLSFKVRIPVSERRNIPSIRKESGRIRAEQRLPGKKIQPIRPDSLAGRIGDSGSDITWIPSMENTGAGKARLISASVSHDASVLFCIEETGEPDKGPFGAYLIMISPEGRRILKYHELERRVTGIASDLSGSDAVCFAESQPELDQQGGFLHLDLKTGKTIRFLPHSRKVCSFLLRKGVLFASFANGTLERIDLKTGKRKTIPAAEDVKLALTGDSKYLAAASESFVRFYRPDDLKLLSEIPLSGGIKPHRLIPGDPGGSFLFLSTDPGLGKSRIYLICNGALKLVSDDSSGEIAYDPAGSALFSGRFFKNRTCRLDPTSFAELASCNPKNLRPATYGTTKFIFRGPGEGEIVIMDSRGAVYLIKNIRRRWIKHLIVRSGGPT